MAAESATRTWRLKAHVWLAARTVPLLVWTLKLSRLLAAVTPDPARRPYQGIDTDQIVQCVQSATRWPIVMRSQRCLREGLLAFHFLHLAGVPAVLHMGLEPASLQVRAKGHCWITVDGRCVINPPTPTMIEVHQHNPGAGAAA